MCLAVPGRIISMEDRGCLPRMAKADIGGIVKEICVDFIEDLKIDDYVIIHVGYALNKINEKEAEEQLKVFIKAEEIINKKIDEIS